MPSPTLCPHTHVAGEFSISLSEKWYLIYQLDRSVVFVLRGFGFRLVWAGFACDHVEAACSATASPLLSPSASFVFAPQ